MLFYFYILVLLISILVMGAGSGLVARSFLKLSRIVGVNEYVISFLLFGVITSIPEIFIALSSIITKTPLLSVGNIIGANFANLTIALGLIAVLSNGLDISRQVSKRVYWLSLLMALMPSFLVFGGGVGRFDGVLLWILFLTYFVVFSYDARFLERSTQHIPYGAHYFSNIYPSVVDFVIGLATLALSSIFIVLFSSGLAGYFSINIILFGTVFMGLITTLPELFFGMRGAILLHPALSLGNILASTVFNSTVILGTLAIASPTVLKSSATGLLSQNAIFMVIAFVLLSIFSTTNSKITRTEGTLLISLYALFILSAFFV